MAWSSKFTPYFSKHIRLRGHAYFRAGAVHIGVGDDHKVSAQVQGTRPYQAELEVQGQNLCVSCTCPYFEREYEQCKHLWALMLAAEAQGRLNAITKILAPGLIDARDADADDGESFDLDPDSTDPGSAPGSDTFSKWRRTPEVPLWQQQMAELRPVAKPSKTNTEPRDAQARELGYFVVLNESQERAFVSIRVGHRTRKKSGDWGVFSLRRNYVDVNATVSSEDDQILSLLVGGGEHAPYAYYATYRGYGGSWPAAYKVPVATLPVLMPIICKTGRCYLIEHTAASNRTSLEWDSGPAWEFWLQGREESNGDVVISGAIRRGDKDTTEHQVSLNEPSLLTPGVVFFEGHTARLDGLETSEWLTLLQQDSLVIPADDRQRFLSVLSQIATVPRLDLPDSLQIAQGVLRSRPQLNVSWSRVESMPGTVGANLRFDYDGAEVDSTDPNRVIESGDKVFWRDTHREQAAKTRLVELGFKNGNRGPNPWTISDSEFGESIRTLIEDGWSVEAEGKPVRKADRTHIEVRSGVDWFELHGSVEFHGQTTSLPELLKAVRRGDRAIALGDGTIGLLPEEWLSRYQKAAAMGTAEDEHISFARSQVALLDFLLEAEPEATFDETFSTLRNHIRSFDGVQPTDPSDAFTGTLREYQRDGLGWLQFLRRFGFGGCLADDMGLGKTIQVLAMFASLEREEDPNSPRPTSDALVPRATSDAPRETPSPKPTSDTPSPKPTSDALVPRPTSDALVPRPSLVVVPRSLIFNWKDEAARFVPNLKVLDYTGLGRSKQRDKINEYDMVLTTYGTLRRDAAILKDIRFNTVVFDEAQAIKNSKTASAKAARLLKSDHRLALTGTPVENHLGELWSLFEVLNPGMLGSVRTFESAVANSRTADPDLELVSRGLRPFILRRTKSEVMKELPEKIEQTIYCELKPKQRRMYNELRQYYKDSLLNGATDDVIRRSKIKVLEALLRLRQASCHPGLIDKERVGETSAKVDALIPLITEVIESGAKALVFSQFTSLLSIVRQRFDDLGVTYEYLDGKTRNRAERVNRFQTDDACPLFLISLKAGGLGLNLTAAEYVFILDPWWNPAAEAQAIDRTHRIGQSRQVFAYRLIARDTVEERILELQQTKKELAGAIIGNQNSLVRSLGREDLEVLFN